MIASGEDHGAVIRPGLCSVTLRQLAVEQVVAVAADAGLAAVEWGADVHVRPADAAGADAARAAGERAGVAVASYGSYFRAGADPFEDFDAVLATAGRLGAPRIRIWAGATASRDADPEQRAAVADGVRHATDLAAEVGIRIALEHHAGTLTDDPDSTLALLDAVDRHTLWTYWQPPEGMPAQTALAGLRRLLPRVAAFHVFSWWPGTERRPLEARAGLWRRAFALGRCRDEDLDALIEFVPGDDAAAVGREARALHELMAP
jgi:sugar phosphate isomerase/epimerase